VSVPQDIYVVSGMGRDVTGLVSLVTSIISDVNGNIIDLEENVFHGIFSIFLTGDLAGARISGLQFIEKMQAVAHQSGLQIAAEKQRLAARARPKRMMRLLLIGPDHPGIVSGATYVLANNGVNIERAEMISRGTLFAMEMDCDWSASPCALALIEKSVSAEMGRVGIRCLFQTEDIYGKRPRLIAFSLGRNVLDEEARESVFGGAAKGSLDRHAAASSLKGLKVETVARVTAGMRLNSDGEDLLHALRVMGFRVALVIDGFDLFLQPLCGYACVDRVCADRLLTEKGKLSGGLDALAEDETGRKSLIAAAAAEMRVPSGDVLVAGDAPPVDIAVSDCGIRAIPDKANIGALLSKGVIADAHLPAILRAFGPL